MRTYRLREGKIVRVVDGPFTGFCGEVKEVDEKSSTVKVAVQVYGRVTPVDVSLNKSNGWHKIQSEVAVSRPGRKRRDGRGTASMLQGRSRRDSQAAGFQSSLGR
jgi:hypothetical protein